MMMGGQEIHHSIVEKYLGDLIHEKGCEQSIKETIKKRMQGLISRTDEIIQMFIIQAFYYMRSIRKYVHINEIL